MIDALFSKQKQGIRAVMPGFVNYYFKEGALPQHTKPFFNGNKILTVHGLIVYNSIILLHKIKYMPQLVPKNILQAFPDDIPTKISDYVIAISWLLLYSSTNFKNSIFYKGPLLSICADEADATTLPTLFFFFFGATLTDLTLASKRPMRTMGPTEAQPFAPSPIFQNEQAGTIARQW